MDQLPAQLSVNIDRVVKVRAGKLIADFEPDTGMIRAIRFDDVEILRGIYGAVRDGQWKMISTAIVHCDHLIDAERFDISFDALCDEAPIKFRWQGTIRGSEDSTIEYEMSGEALNEFEKNRIGLCVLHPIAPCAGRACRIETTDGVVHEDRFPNAISPRQPFRQVRSISYTVDRSACVTTFEGDEFETEDQRNWSDASYKTYSTPLDRPFPVKVTAGFKMRQKVTLRIETDRAENSPPPSNMTKTRGVETFRLADSTIVLPKLGLCLASDGRQPAQHPGQRHERSSSSAELSGASQQRLRDLRLDHVRIDVHFARSDWQDRLFRDRTDAAKIGAAPHVALHCSPGHAEHQLRAVQDAMRLPIVSERPVSTWLLFEEGAPATPPRLLSIARELLLQNASTPRLAAGTDLHFAELNRNRPSPGSADAFTFALTPQAHLTDTRTMVESLEVQAQMVASAKSFCGSADVMISPVTLCSRKPRFPNDEPFDFRQSTPFAAAWTLASVVELARGGAASLTYYETTGPRGVMGWETTTAAASDQGEQTHIVYPLYHVLADLAELHAGERANVTPIAGAGVAGVVHRNGNRITLLLCNLDDTTRAVRLPIDLFDQGCRARRRELSDGACARATDPQQLREQDWAPLASEILELLPWAYLRIEAPANE